MPVQYKVNPEKKVVVAMFVLDSFTNNQFAYWVSSIHEDICKLDANVGAQTYYNDIDKFAEQAVMQTDSLSGVARCHPDDVWDENKGKQIAKRKLLNKFFRAENVALRKYMQYIKRTSEVKLDRALKKIEKHNKRINKGA